MQFGTPLAIGKAKFFDTAKATWKKLKIFSAQSQVWHGFRNIKGKRKFLDNSDNQTPHKAVRLYSQIHSLKTRDGG